MRYLDPSEYGTRDIIGILVAIDVIDVAPDIGLFAISGAHGFVTAGVAGIVSELVGAYIATGSLSRGAYGWLDQWTCSNCLC